MTEEQYWRHVLPIHKLRALYEAEQRRGMRGGWPVTAPHTIWVMGRVLRERIAAETPEPVQTNSAVGAAQRETVASK